MSAESALDARGSARISTLELFGLLCAATLAMAFYTNEVVLTRDAYHSMLGGQLDASRIDVLYQLTRKMQVLGYVLAPLFLALQLWFLAFVVQLCALLFGNEVALGAMFRLSVVARFAILADTAARSFWLGTMPASSVTKEMLSVVPWSFAGLFMRPEDALSPSYAFAAAINPAELAWCLIMVVGLARGAKMTMARSAAVVGGIWLAAQLMSYVLRSFLTP